MLRITVHEDSGVWRLNLSGKLAGPWVKETENVWRSAPASGTRIEVDLKDVTGVDTAGRTLLAAMHQAGARLLAGGVENSALVGEIMADSIRANAAASGTAGKKTQEGDK